MDLAVRFPLGGCFISGEELVLGFRLPFLCLISLRFLELCLVIGGVVRIGLIFVYFCFVFLLSMQVCLRDSDMVENLKSSIFVYIVYTVLNVT